MWEGTPTLQQWGVLAPTLSYQALESNLKYNQGVKNLQFSVSFLVHTCSKLRMAHVIK